MRNGSTITNVVVLAPMPYEVVFQVQQSANSERISDPSLWWGLSTVIELIDNGTLDLARNPDLADDGYLLYRPAFRGPDTLIPEQLYKTALGDGHLTWSVETKVK
ncbi:hypothetical protein [Alicyclobacillus mengziensis]|uniref:Uncharacterized protein n=1 Tax=Alicyclobacillus mengziensis TaxID=2931921 RepID=A0A9X7VWR9_9BACL|nr:hypothetical protein [Alicyclobacillus mengziensis]QSO46464.1 hypothetical protein JZ786_18625 [Alicyclobacillus mengziensis]